MAEEWNKYYTIEEIKKIQQIELTSLDVFSDMCEKLGITFYLYGGSLLGAIKYNGFVPWDDDFDICLKRKDYDLLIEKGPELIPEKYELQHPRINSSTPFPYAKFRRTDTRLVDQWNSGLRINQGVYFDIYPIDNIPDDVTLYIKQKIKYDKWVHIFQIRQNYRLDIQFSPIIHCIRTTIRFVQSYVAHLFSVNYLIKKIDQISTEFNNETTVNQGNLSYPKPINYFSCMDIKECIFEGRVLNIPSGYKVNLRNRYGDIRRLPPENNRVGHKPLRIELECEDK